MIIHNPSLSSFQDPQKIELDRFSRFDVIRLQTNKQKPRQAKYIYIGWKSRVVLTFVKDKFIFLNVTRFMASKA